ncbi:MAG: ABC transporter permease [Candidatus Saccharibacteria bacterium]|nr:ABC transporter permease [Candidatus Saccharibacteria bacterium]
MKKLLILTLRNIKAYFSDKSIFLTSLVTPAILLVLYATFLGNIFEETFTGAIPAGLEVSDKIIKALVSGEILASLLAVSCITVSFTSNLLMVTDKVNGPAKDLNVSPVSNSTKSLAYFLASFFSTIIVNIVALALCLFYTSTQGWFYDATDILLLLGDIVLLTLFGCALSSVINFLLKSQGQVSAVSTIISAGYGFICGAYMPIASFSITLQKVLSFLPGTYGTSMIKNHALSAPFNELTNSGVPIEVVNEIKASLDCSLSFFGHDVSMSVMYLIMIIAIVALLVVFIIENKCKRRA